MSTNLVTVQGAHGSISLPYDTQANAMLARYIAGALATGIGNASIIAYDSSNLPSPPPLASGETGEWAQVTSPVGGVTIPKGYDFVVDSAPTATFNDDNPDTDQAWLVAGGNLALNATFGAGSVIGGGGNNDIVIAAINPNAWLIALGNGNDTVKALGSGNDTISVGTGSDSIQLGAGSSAITTAGAATITASTGSETITGTNTDVIYGGASTLTFVATGGSTVFGGTGSDTVTGGNGPDLYYGGSAGHNVLKAGVGAATLFGGGTGDQLFANGSGTQILYAATGNETLTGSSVGGATDTFVAGYSGGAATVNANVADNNLFEFINRASSPPTELVKGLSSVNQISIHLSGYGANNISNVTSQNIGNGSLVVTLSDSTQVTFQNITSTLTSGNFS